MVTASHSRVISVLKLEDTLVFYQSFKLSKIVHNSLRPSIEVMAWRMGCWSSFSRCLMARSRATTCSFLCLRYHSIYLNQRLKEIEVLNLYSGIFIPFTLIFVPQLFQLAFPVRFFMISSILMAFSWKHMNLKH